MMLWIILDELSGNSYRYLDDAANHVRNMQSSPMRIAQFGDKTGLPGTVASRFTSHTLISA